MDRKKQYKFKVVEFLTKKQQKYIDVVPASWIMYDDDKKQLYSKFAGDGPFSPEESDEIEKLIESCAPPKDTWIYYPITVRGRANDYDDAVEKVEQLKKQSYAFSTDDESSAENKSQEEFQSYKRRSMLKNPPSTSQQQEKAAQNLNTISEVDENVSLNGDTTATRGVPHTAQIHRINTLSRTTSSGSDMSDIEAEESDKKTTPASRNSSAAPQKSSGQRSNSSKQDLDKKLPSKRQSKAAKVANDQTNFPASTETPAADDTMPNSSQTDDNAKDNLSRQAVAQAPATMPNVVSNIQKHISNYVSEHKDEITDPTFLTIAGIWSLNVQMRQLRASMSTLVGGTAAQQASMELITRTMAENVGNIEDNALGNTMELTYRQQVSIPFDTLKKFAEFDKNLLADKKLQQQTRNFCKHLVSTELGIVRCIGIILRAYMTKELGLTFTTKKKVPNKEVFNTTTFYTCLQDLAMKLWKDSHGSPVTAIIFQRSVASVINNVKDWKSVSGSRKKRGNKNNDALDAVEAGEIENDDES